MPFKLSGIFRVHAAGNMQYDLTTNLSLFNGHNIPKVPYAGLNVNYCNFQPRPSVHRESQIIGHLPSAVLVASLNQPSKCGLIHRGLAASKMQTKPAIVPAE